VAAEPSIAATIRNTCAWRDDFTAFLPFKSSVGDERRQIPQSIEVLIEGAAR
jgi:hypothetical protein